MDVDQVTMKISSMI